MHVAMHSSRSNRATTFLSLQWASLVSLIAQIKIPRSRSSSDCCRVSCNDAEDKRKQLMSSPIDLCVHVAEMNESSRQSITFLRTLRNDWGHVSLICLLRVLSCYWQLLRGGGGFTNQTKQHSPNFPSIVVVSAQECVCKCNVGTWMMASHYAQCFESVTSHTSILGKMWERKKWKFSSSSS